METLHQRDRRDLEILRYPHLASEIIRRDAAFCQHMSDVWQQLILTPLAERLIPARVNRPVAFETFGHWGPWAHTENWGGLATARFINEASMLSWLIASYHIAGNFLFFTMLHFGIILPQFAPVHSNVGEQAKTIALVAIAPTFAMPSLPRSSIRVGTGHNSPISRNYYRSSQRVSRFCYVCNCATCSRLDIDPGFAD